MRRVAVFGNAGGGKSTLARRLAAATDLPLHVIDEMQFRDGGAAVPEDEYLRNHAELLCRDEWIIDGFGGMRAAWERFSAADTLVLVDLPLITHYWWVTKRLILGLFATPKGWPPDSPVWSSSMSSYRVIPACHRHLTPRYRRLITESASSKRVHHLRSRAAIEAFIDQVGRACAPRRRSCSS